MCNTDNVVYVNLKLLQQYTITMYNSIHHEHLNLCDDSQIHTGNNIDYSSFTSMHFISLHCQVHTLTTGLYTDGQAHEP